MFTKKIISHFFGISCTYLIYFFPFDILISFLYEDNIFQLTSLISCFFLYLIINFYFRSQTKPKFLRLLIFEGMGIGFISLSIVITSVIIKLFFKTNDFYLVTTCIFTIFFLSIVGLINGRSIRKKTIKVASNKVKKKLKLVFISDIHLGSNSEKHLQNIFSKLENINFDILLIGGDLIDLSSFNLQSLKIFNLIKKPVLYVTGNHEHYLTNWNKISKRLAHFNIKNIDGKAFRFDEINIIGVGDNMTMNKKKIIVANNYQKERFNLVLCHKPSLWKEIQTINDLTLAGHTHGGQIFPFNLFVRFKFKEIYGIFKKSGSTLFVSSGAACWGPRMRLGSQNEVVEIIIE